MRKIKTCKHCNHSLEKDWIALNKKLLNRNNTEYLCLECLADYLDCSTKDLQVKIEEFKEQGCTLFG